MPKILQFTEILLKYLVPYKYISNQDKIIRNYYNMGIEFKKSNQDILVGKMKEKN